MPNGKDGGIQLRLANGKKSRTIANYDGYLEMKLQNETNYKPVSECKNQLFTNTKKPICRDLGYKESKIATPPIAPKPPYHFGTPFCDNLEKDFNL